MAGEHCINNKAMIDSFYKKENNNYDAVKKVLDRPEPAASEDQRAVKHEVESAESEEGQFERENEDQSTMP